MGNRHHTPLHFFLVCYTDGGGAGRGWMMLKNGGISEALPSVHGKCQWLVSQCAIEIYLKSWKCTMTRIKIKST
jgi:hypothetical protein